MLTPEQIKDIQSELGKGWSLFDVVQKVTAEIDDDDKTITVYAVADEAVNDATLDLLEDETMYCVMYAGNRVELSLYNQFKLVTEPMTEPKNLGWVYVRDETTRKPKRKLTRPQINAIKAALGKDLGFFLDVEKVTAEYHVDSDAIDVYVMPNRPISKGIESIICDAALECISRLRDCEYWLMPNDTFTLVTEPMTEPKNLGWFFLREDDARAD